MLDITKIGNYHMSPLSSTQKLSSTKKSPGTNSEWLKSGGTNMVMTSLNCRSASCVVHDKIGEAFVAWKSNSLEKFKFSKNELELLKSELKRQNGNFKRSKAAYKFLKDYNGQYGSRFEEFGSALFTISKVIFLSRETAMESLFECVKEGLFTQQELYQNSYLSQLMNVKGIELSLSLEQIALIIKKILEVKYNLNG